MKRLGLSLAAGVFLTMLVGCAASPESGAGTPSRAEQARSISTAFICNCAECPLMRLDTCYCEYAEETKAYIRQLVARGTYSREEIIAKVDSRYGGLRRGTKKSAGK